MTGRKPWELDPEDYDPQRADTPIHTRGPLEGQPIDPHREPQRRQRDVLRDRTPFEVLAEPRYQQATVGWPGDGRALPIWHLDGTDWLDAPAPPRFHRHRAQTIGYLHTSEREFWRCPCGAFGSPTEPWLVIGERRVAPGWLRRTLTTLARGKPRHNGTEQEKP